MCTGELLGKPEKLRGVTCDGLASRPGRVDILLEASCDRNAGLSKKQFGKIKYWLAKEQNYCIKIIATSSV